MVSRAKTLCKLVHESAEGWGQPLSFDMEVKGINGTATYHFSNLNHPHLIHVVEQQLSKDDQKQLLIDLSHLNIGTLEKVTFKDVDLQFVQAVVQMLQEHNIYLWTVGNGYKQWSFKVLKSTTTAEEYATMRTKYDTAPAGPVKIDKKGYPSRQVGRSYRDMGLNDCAMWDAYPASYSSGNRPNRPARYCEEGSVHKAPDGTNWRVECPKEEREVCKWKVSPNQVKVSKGYERVQQLGAVPRGDVKVDGNQPLPQPFGVFSASSSNQPNPPNPNLGDVIRVPIDRSNQVPSSSNEPKLPSPFGFGYLEGPLRLTEINQRERENSELVRPVASYSPIYPDPPDPDIPDEDIDMRSVSEDESDGTDVPLDRMDSIAGRNLARNRDRHRITFRGRNMSGPRSSATGATGATRVNPKTLVRRYRSEP